MENREQYDPDDLEHLMLERSFGDLMEEERAFALRHVADAAEYGRMRALLQQVHAQDRDLGAQDAGPEVRERVLQAFRSRQRPEWRFSMNSFGAAFLPSRSSGMWRPALVLGALVLAVLTVVQVRRASEAAKPAQLAEVPVIRQAQQQARPHPEEPAQAQAPAAHAAKGDAADAPLGESSGWKRQEARAQGNAMPPPPSPAEPNAGADIVLGPGAGSSKSGLAEMKEESIAATAARSAVAEVDGMAAAEPAMDATTRKKAAPQHGAYTEADLLGLLQQAW